MLVSDVVYVCAMFMRPCNISPSPGCHCRDPERPQVTCSALGITTLPHFHPNMSAIHTLRYPNNQIKSVTSFSFENLTGLKRLLLDHNKINQIVELAFFKQEASLTWLDLSHNKLPGIPFAIWRLHNLHILDLRHNKIETISGGIMSRLSNLKDLYLEDNPISLLSKTAFIGLNSLVSLSISIPVHGYNLNNFPVKNVPKLETFWLTNTGLNLTHSKRFFGSLPHLQSLGLVNCGLSVRDNPLMHLPTRKIKGLKHLSLANNSLLLITHYSTSARKLKDLKHLETLDLSGNKISRLNKGMRHIFKRLLSLRHLHLQNNYISSFHASIISDLRNLTFLDLSNNNLNTLYSWDRLKDVKKLHIRLAGNPWRCDCELKWLKVMIDEKVQKHHGNLENYEVYHELRCSKPSVLRGLLIKDVAQKGVRCYKPKPRYLPRVCEQYNDPFCLNFVQMDLKG